MDTIKTKLLPTMVMVMLLSACNQSEEAFSKFPVDDNAINVKFSDGEEINGEEIFEEDEIIVEREEEEKDDGKKDDDDSVVVDGGGDDTTDGGGDDTVTDGGGDDDSDDSDDGDDDSTETEKVSDSHKIQSTEAQADIVWIIDNSGSMGDDQKSLKDNMNVFQDAFLDNNQIDFAMAFTTTDPRESKSGLFQNGADQVTAQSLAEDAELFKIYFTGDQAALDAYRSRDDSPLEFSSSKIGKTWSYVTPGTRGPGKELGLQAALESLKRSEASNVKFYNKASTDRWTFFVVLSDEDDDSIGGNGFQGLKNIDNKAVYVDQIPDMDAVKSGVSDHLQMIRDQLSALGKDGDKLKFYSIVNTMEKSLKRTPEKIGVRYMEASAQTGGKAYDIKGSYGEILAKMADSLKTVLTKTYKLNKVPTSADSISVSINGELLDATGWSYDATTNEVILAAEPKDGDELVISYSVEKK